MKQAIFSFLQISAYTFGYLYFASNATLAQVTSDGTVNTIVNQNGNIAEITGGETRGSNLFHSFQDFSVPTGNEAFFDNTNDISNIFSRVTGGNISNIDGVIRANGSASLFLINPAGIIFGENARLDIGGSFYGSTASSILFEEGEFSAVDHLEQPILTINAPIGLGFRDEPGNIINRSDLSETRIFVETDINGEDVYYEYPRDRIGLKVSQGNNIALIGGNVSIEKSGITAPGGRASLGGLSQSGVVTFNADGSFIFPEEIEKADLSLISDGDSSGGLRPSVIDVGSNAGGFIDLNARDLVVRNSNIFLGIEAGLSDSVGGDINLNADSMVLKNLFIESTVFNGEGRVGDINLNADSLVLNNSRIESDVFNGEGRVGDINLNADSLVLYNSFLRSTISSKEGKGGDINLNADSLVLNTSFIDSSRVAREGMVGDINLNASSISLNYSWIESTVFYIFNPGAGNLGNINLNTDSLSLNNSRIISGMIINGRFDQEIVIEGDLNFGDIAIDTNSLVLNNNSWIVSTLNYHLVNHGGDIFLKGDLNFGDIEIDANSLVLDNNSLIISDMNTTLYEGDIFFEGDLDLGNIDLSTNSLSIANNSDIITQTNTSANAANLQIYATESIKISGINSSISSQTGNSGNAGKININTPKLTIVDNGQISTSNFLNETWKITFDGRLTRNILDQQIEGLGDAGTINITANNVSLKDRGGITALSSAGNGGNINLRVNDVLSLRNNSKISATAGELETPGNGGNIDINSKFIVAFPNSNNDITANAFEGAGGNITIATEGIFGIQERPQNYRTNDITASSEMSRSNNVLITPADLNSVRGATELPNNVIMTEETTTQACQANRETAAKNGLSITGKGGISFAPDLPLNSHNISVNGEYINSTSVIPQPIETSKGKIQPARGIKLTETGEIILTPYRTNNAGERIPEGAINCDRT